ncbi:MAG TPA: hypothetical protein VHF27_10255 [Acidimicrobiales bacterium]|nr:hypothetical protein [Acidimicrobiales bacterium]
MTRVEVKIGGPEQLGLSGPKRVNVIVPVGLTPPDTVAVSVMVPPTGTGGEAWVVRTTRAGATANRSAGSPQPTGVVIGA